MPNWPKIEDIISTATGQTFELKHHSVVGGGDINQAFRLDGVLNSEPSRFFIKVNNKNRLNMFTAEAAGLKELQKANSIRVPGVIATGLDETNSFLILEYLSFSAAQASNNSAMIFGEQLAKMHQRTQPKFGWEQANTIGSTKQINTPTEHWVDFWREHRLAVQCELAKQNGASTTLLNKADKLMQNLQALFVGYAPIASLLHGDLWSGNYRYAALDGAPILFDPAVYYGDRETDIAMTELFGGFSDEFYASYQQTWPLHEGYAQRKTLYNLYHVLNHFNLFQGGYAAQAENMIDKLLHYI
ncbi:MAG: fructosamine kinase family protein [Woeseiaceae bacterium]